MSKKKIIGGLAVACAMLGAAVPANASASMYCPRTATYDQTRGGYGVSYSAAYARGMNCASVQYAHRFFRRKVRAQSSWPHMPRAFWDGWVTWHCHTGPGHSVRCAEYTSGTSYRFRAYVWD